MYHGIVSYPSSNVQLGQQRQTEKKYNIFKIFNKGIICIQEYILGDYFYKRSIHIKYNYKILYH